MDSGLINPEINKLEIDYLYHFGIDTSMELDKVFAGVQYVVLTSSNEDIKIFANCFARSLYDINEDDFSFIPIYKTERHHLYKIGPVLAVSFGVGVPSLSICVNEIAKLLFHLKLTDVKFLKFGPAFGINKTPGSIMLVDEAVNSKLEPVFTNIECGVERSYTTSFDSKLTHEVCDFLTSNNSPVARGKSITVNNFYDESGLMISALSDSYAKSEYTEYFKKAQNYGAISMDMDSTYLAGFCGALKMPVAAVNYIIGDLLNIEGIDKTYHGDKHKLSVINMLANYIISNTSSK